MVGSFGEHRDALTMEVSLTYKGRTEKLIVNADESTGRLFEAVRGIFSLREQNLKILAKGKTLAADVPIASTNLAAGAKCMVMATGLRDVAEVLSAKSDPTIRSFSSEDALAKRHLEQTDPKAQEVSDWGTVQHAKYKFCRFEACTWQSFGTRPSSSTPHTFEARALLLKLATDPAVTAIMADREWTVGLLAELDPVDDRLAEKMEGGGKRLLGYNTNAGGARAPHTLDQQLRLALSNPSSLTRLSPRGVPQPKSICACARKTCLASCRTRPSSTRS